MMNVMFLFEKLDVIRNVLFEGKPFPLIVFL